MMVSDHINYLTFEDPGAVNTVRRALKLAQAGDLHGAAEVAGVDVAHAAVVSEGLRRGMRFAIGAELDADPRSRPDAQNIVEAMRPDGMIRSVHFLTIDHPEKGADFAWPFDNPEFTWLFEHVGVEKTWEMYVDRLIEDIEKLPGHIVGHFYVPAIFGHWPDKKKLEQYENRLLDACALRGMAVEINTRYLYRDHTDEQRKKFTDAYLRLLRKAKAKRVGIAIGSDAHSPRDQGAGFDVVLKMLDEAGVNEIVFPVNGRLARVALRATKEHLERQAQTREPISPGSSITGFSRAELGLPDQPDAPAKKRATGPTRTTKSPKAPRAPKAPKAPKPEKPPKPQKPPKAVKAPTKAAPAKKVAAPAKKVAAPAKKVAAPTKKVAATAKKSAPTKKVATDKKVAGPPKKSPPAKKLAAPAKKSAAPAKKPTPAKKSVARAKKITAPAKKAASAKKAPVPAKKAASAKKPAKPLASAKKPAAKKPAVPANKAAAKKPAKGIVGKAAVKKKPATKRR